MRERWCFVTVGLVAGCFLADTILQQVAADDAQQKQCLTSSNKKGYCTTKEQCHDQELVDLRTSFCDDSTPYCCPIRDESIPSWSNKKLFTQCDSNRGYCVKSDMCSVRTFRLRSNRCPKFEEVCCPKHTFPEGFPGTITNVAKNAIPLPVTISTNYEQDSTTTTISTSTTSATTTITTTTTTKPVTTTTSTSTATVSTMSPGMTTSTSSSTDDDASECIKLLTNQNTVDQKDTTQSSNANMTTTATTDLQSSETNLTPASITNDDISSSTDPMFWDENTFQNLPTFLKPVPTALPNTDATDRANQTALMSQFTPENFVYDACGQLNPNGVVERPILQDFQAEYGEFPWMVALFQLPDKRYCCNGALIEANAILTTAHCVTRCEGQIVARFGEWNMSSTQEMPISREDIGVRSVHKHPDYFPSSLINNIAVLELNQAVQYRATVQPVCLPSGEHSLRSRENMIATGWGTVLAQSSSSFQVLKRLDLQRMEPSICKEELKRVQRPYKFTLHSSFVCVTTNHDTQERPCDGDAGGPVVVELPGTINRYYLHGLVSWGYGCNQKRIPYTVLTKVVHFREWIDDIVQTLNRKKAKKGHSSKRD